MTAALVQSDRDWAMELYALFARGGDDEALFYSEIEGDPWSKSRPRFARGGQTYQPRDDRLAELATRTRLMAAGAPRFEGNVMLACRFYRPNRQRIDTDNLLKHVCDSANGVLWADDSQVTLALGEIALDADRPRTVIVAGNHLSTLTRGADAVHPCKVCGNPISDLGSSAKRATCSRGCAAKAKGYVALDEPVPCSHCGDPFRRTTTAQRMCSPACRIDSLRAKRRAAAAPFSACVTCGKTLTHRRGGQCRQCWSDSHQLQDAAS